MTVNLILSSNIILLLCWSSVNQAYDVRIDESDRNNLTTAFERFLKTLGSETFQGYRFFVQKESLDSVRVKTCMEQNEKKSVHRIKKTCFYNEKKKRPRRVLSVTGGTAKFRRGNSSEKKNNEMGGGRTTERVRGKETHGTRGRVRAYDGGATASLHLARCIGRG